MAQKVTVSLVDDLSGTKADETVAFGLDGKSYEIDLSSGNAGKLRGALAAYVSAARRGGGARRSDAVRDGGARRASADRERNQAIRDWARGQGRTVSERGRIPAELLAAYDKEN